MHKKFLARVFGIALATAAITPTVNATVINTGVIEVYSPYRGRYSFDFEILGLSANGMVDESAWSIRRGYEGSSFTGNIGKGPDERIVGFIGDQPVDWRDGRGPVRTTLNTTASGGVLAPGQTIYQSSFEFVGSLCAISMTAPYGTPCDVAFPSLTGQGIAEFVFEESILDDGRHYFTPLKATYTFHPVPEPAMLALFCVGIAGFGFTSRTRFRREA